MKKDILTIKSFLVKEKELIIISKKDIEYYLECEEGTVLTPIQTCQKDLVSINYLSIGDIIKIKYFNLNSNKIIIKKIYIKTKYDFNSDSSEDSDILIYS